jgi:hypothetical protein
VLACAHVQALLKASAGPRGLTRLLMLCDDKWMQGDVRLSTEPPLWRLVDIRLPQSTSDTLQVHVRVEFHSTATLEAVSSRSFKVRVLACSFHFSYQYPGNAFVMPSTRRLCC